MIIFERWGAGEGQIQYRVYCPNMVPRTHLSTINLNKANVQNNYHPFLRWPIFSYNWGVPGFDSFVRE